MKISLQLIPHVNQKDQQNVVNKKILLTWKIIYFQQKLSTAHHQLQSVHSVDQRKSEENGAATSATAC